MLSFLYSLDVYLLQLVNLTYHSILTNDIALLISYLGILFFWIIICIILYLFGNDKAKKASIRLFVALLCIMIISQLIKYAVMRPRPYTQLSDLIVVSVGTDPSFPSGHTSTSTTASYILAKEYGKYYLLCIPVIVAISRLYLGVHYPSDVLVGFIIGIIVAYIVEKLFEKLEF